MKNQKKQLSRIQEHLIVRKANSLVEASYKLSTNEQRVILMLCAVVSPKCNDFQPYRIRVKEFADFIGLKNKNFYAEAEKLVMNLREKTLKITTDKSVLHIGWLSSIEYFPGEGMIEMCFDPKLTPFLIDLQRRFTTYHLKEIIQLKSSFSIRLYELLKQYEGIGERCFEIDHLKDILGIADDTYRLYGSFKQKVLAVARREINKETDISFSFTEEKEARKVVRLKFHIQANIRTETPPKPEKQKEEENEDLQRLASMLPEQYQRQVSVKRLLAGFLKRKDFDYVARNIQYANARSNAVTKGASWGKGSNYRNYLAMALERDFGLPFKEDLEVSQSNQATNRQRETELARMKEAEMNKIRQDQENMDRARIYQESLTPETLIKLREEAFDTLDPQQKALVLQKVPGAEMLIKFAMTHICLKRMNITQPDLFHEAAADTKSPAR